MIDMEVTMDNFTRVIFVLGLILFLGTMGVFLTGCAVSGCGNPASNSTMSDSNNSLGSFNEPYQPIHIEQQAERAKPSRDIFVHRFGRTKRNKDYS